MTYGIKACDGVLGGFLGWLSLLHRVLSLGAGLTVSFCIVSHICVRIRLECFGDEK